ncbi:MAG: IS200/IS605 family transposase [Planctomycetota bacterium]|jgi:REP element-mobilizing transposase RayT
MAHTLTKILVHCVFSTKERRPFISDDLDGRLNEYAAGIARNHDMHLIRAGGTSDHRHLLLQFRPTVCISDGVRILKSNASKWVHETFDGLSTFAWQSGYAAFSVSQSAAARVVAYIDGQEQHHKRLTFQEELIALLDRHGVEYDPEHLWD